MGFDVSLGFGAGEDEWNPFEVEGGLCNVPEDTFIKLGSWERISLEELIPSGAKEHLAQHPLDNPHLQRRLADNSACFERIEVEYYPACQPLLTLHATDRAV